jgi:hypothetical protein
MYVLTTVVFINLDLPLTVVEDGHSACTLHTQPECAQLRFFEYIARRVLEN